MAQTSSASASIMFLRRRGSVPAAALRPREPRSRNRERPRRLRPFKGGPPAHDHLGDIPVVLDPDQWPRCFVVWTATLTGLLADVIAIDGNTARRPASGRTGAAADHMDPAFAARLRIIPGQVKVSGMSNEIVAIPKLLERRRRADAGLADGSRRSGPADAGDDEHSRPRRCRPGIGPDRQVVPREAEPPRNAMIEAFDTRVAPPPAASVSTLRGTTPAAPTRRRSRPIWPATTAGPADLPASSGAQPQADRAAPVALQGQDIVERARSAPGRLQGGHRMFHLAAGLPVSAGAAGATSTWNICTFTPARACATAFSTAALSTCSRSACLA